jgi:hypothetical protein
VSSAGDSRVDLRLAYDVARRAFRPRDRGFLDPRPAHRFFWIQETSIVGQMTLLAHPDAFAIVGRHPQCGITLPNDEGVALRHLMIRSVSIKNATAASARILDLRTETGFSLADGSRQTAIYAEGPIAITVGEYALIGFPTGPGEDAPPELPPPRIDAPAATPGLPSSSAPMSPYRVNARPKGTSRITLMPRLVFLGLAPPSDADGGAPFAVRLERDGRSAQVSLSEADVDAGVVIGRSEACHAELLRRITNQNTSRVHVLLLREQEQLSAYDLASTHGTFKDRFPVRRAELGVLTVLTLGSGPGSVQLTFTRR